MIESEQITSLCCFYDKQARKFYTVAQMGKNVAGYPGVSGVDPIFNLQQFYLSGGFATFLCPSLPAVYHLCVTLLLFVWTYN